MKVIISAGGTGGHIYPALAIINKIKEQEPNSEFLYIGTHNRMEKDIVPENNIPFVSIEMYGFYRKELYKNIKTSACLVKSYYQCKKIIKKFDPDIVIGVGGYVTAPVIKAAHKLGYKTFIHEQNSVPGATNMYLSKIVNSIGVSLKSTLDLFPNNKVIFTGNPCSVGARNAKAINKTELKLDPKRKLVLFVMGSLGSSKMNEILCKMMPKFENKKYEILFVTGKDDYDNIIKNKFPDNVKVVSYVPNLPRVMKKTDVIVTRAGASTISEIIALKLPAILIPSPYVTNNHQYKNAMDLVRENAAILVEEKELVNDKLVRVIDELLDNPKQIKAMSNNLAKLDKLDSADVIYKELKRLISKGSL